MQGRSDSNPSTRAAEYGKAKEWKKKQQKATKSGLHTAIKFKKGD